MAKFPKKHKKQLNIGKSKYKEDIKEAIMQELRQERSKLDQKNNVRTFWEIYQTQEHKKRSTPKKRISLKKVSFSLHKCLTEIFSNVTFRISHEKDYFIVGGIKNQKFSLGH